MKPGTSTIKGPKARRQMTNRNKYLRQWARTAKNKEAAWKKHLANHPNDIQAKLAIEVTRNREALSPRKSLF